MRHANPPLHPRTRALSALIGSLFGSAALLSACGGSSSSDSPTDPLLLPTTTVSRVVRVVDGPITGALVCLDKNNNNACDTDETQDHTGADGSVTLQVPSADDGQYAVLAEVDTKAVDAVNGPVTTAYVLKAPADRPALVSPLTTLVAAQQDAAGGSSGDAEKALQDKLGISGSLFVDTSKLQNDDASQHAARIARLVVLVTQQQTRDTAGARDSQGQPLSAPDLATAQRNSLLSVLPTLVAAATDPALVAAKAADKEDALKAAALGISAAAGLTAANVGAVLAQAKLPPGADSSSEVPTAGTSLRWFSYAGAGNYSLRMYKSSATQNTVLNGKRQFTEYREQSSASNGNVTFYQQWGEGLNNWARNQTVWTGSAWFDCPTDQVHETTPWDAMGQSDSLYCKAFKTRSKRAERNLENVVMADLVKEIRAYPLVDSAGKFSDWGPDPVANAAALAGMFPAGSKLYYQTGSDTANPDTYNTAASDVYMPYNTAVAGGVVAECNKVTSSNSVLFRSEAATLEAMVAAALGQPCVFGVGNNTGETKNEWWGNSTFDIGDVSTPYTNSTGFYKVGVKDLRASFGTGNVLNFWLCLHRTSDNSPRNCTSAGNGSYSIDESLADARVLRLAGLPTIAGNLSYQRIMVQRGGKVYYGSRSKLALTHQVRLNGSASQALFTALGMPAAQAAPAKLSPTLLLDRYIGSGGAGTLNRNSLALLDNDPASLVGAWALNSATNPRTQVLVFFADGQYVMADPQGATAPSLCGGPGIELGGYSFDKAAGRLRFLSIARDSNGCAGGHDTNDNSFGAPGVVLSADGKTAAITFNDGSGGGTLYRLTK
jgi:hypothetical protein